MQDTMLGGTKKKLDLDRDAIWAQIRDEASAAIRGEPLLGSVIHAGLLHHESLEFALAYRFSQKLASGEMNEQILREIVDDAYAKSPELADASRADLLAVYDRDPATHRLI